MFNRVSTSKSSAVEDSNVIATSASKPAISIKRERYREGERERERERKRERER